MKTTIAIAIAILASAPGLVAGETNSLPTSLPAKEESALQVNVVEQADLVRQIGEDAARGFDPGTYAQWLRRQIDALVAKPVAIPVSAATPTTKPDLDLPRKPAAPAPEVALRETIAKLRALAQELEAQVSVK